MIAFLQKLFESESLAPHGICLLWRPELIWTHVISDALIGAAYFSIPLALGYFVSKRRDVAFSWVFWCFALFILACGTTHFFAIWTLWNPDYGTEAVIKALTAAISVATAALLWPLLPRALALPSPEQLRQANRDLSARIAERDAALAALERETQERLRAEEMLRQSQKMQAIGQLTGGVAHDFNNLLTVIVANLDRIERRLPGGDEDLRRSASHAIAAADRATALTHQLLAFSRKQALNPSRVDPRALVGNMAELLRRTIGDEIRLETSLAPDLMPVQVDANQMENALLNLAVNARDAMPGGGTLTISARNLTLLEAAAVPPLAGAPHIVLEVSDTGTGMSPEVMERVFEPFFTTKPVGRGTGLGLSQVYGFVTQSRGHVILASSPGQGTTVRLYLPQITAAAAAPAGTAAEASGPEPWGAAAIA